MIASLNMAIFFAGPKYDYIERCNRYRDTVNNNRHEINEFEDDYFDGIHFVSIDLSRLNG